MQYRVYVYNRDGDVMRKMIVLADDPDNACEWGNDWMDLYAGSRNAAFTVGWRVEAFEEEERN